MPEAPRRTGNLIVNPLWVRQSREGAERRQAQGGSEALRTAYDDGVARRAAEAAVERQRRAEEEARRPREYAERIDRYLKDKTSPDELRAAAERGERSVDVRTDRRVPDFFPTDSKDLRRKLDLEAARRRVRELRERGYNASVSYAWQYDKEGPDRSPPIYYNEPQVHVEW